MATIIVPLLDKEETEFLISQISTSVSEKLKIELQSLSLQPQNNILTRQQVAELLGISLPTLYDYTKSGIIKAHRLGTTIRYKREDIENALKEISYGRKTR